MRIQSVSVRSFKRFTDLQILTLPQEAKLVMLVGPNGSGKSSLFDAFIIWALHHSVYRSVGIDNEYHPKKGFSAQSTTQDLSQDLSIVFHQELPDAQQSRQRLFYVRTAYRNEPDFVTDAIRRLGPEENRQHVGRLIDNDVSVSTNYESLVGTTIDGLFNGAYDHLTGAQIADELVGQVRASMARIFDDLILRGPGDPLSKGTFFFEKGDSVDFHYKNLSGGEKAAFDLILDFILKRQTYRDTIFCIDEPEAHMNTRLQGSLLKELVRLIPDGCQLWIATHSIGMMREARDIQRVDQSSVVFLDFFDRDFDQPVVLKPAAVDRNFWKKTLDVALGDMAGLVAPRQVVLCEGRPATQDRGKAEFDARCYRTIFDQEYPDTAFISVGNEKEVRQDSVRLGPTIEALVNGVTVVRVVDRDERSSQEIMDLQKEGIRVLSERHLEAYLMSDEILTKLCKLQGREDLISKALAAKQKAITSSVTRRNPPDDIKSASGEIYNDVKALLNLTQSGSDARSFMRDCLAKLVTPETNSYANIKRDIFGE